MIGATGIWSEEEQSAHIFSYGVARWISKHLDKQQPVMDLGCGNGTLLRYLNEVGFYLTTGIDGFTPKEQDFNFIKGDLAQPIALKDRIFNVISLEVFEHIPKEFEQTYVNNICQFCCDKLIISVAHEGQQGLGHVNTRPDWYVKELFEGKGFKFEKELTESIRQQPEGYVAYLKENLFVFTKI